MKVIKKCLRRARKSWHPDHWRQFKTNENITDNTAYEKAEYVWKILNQANSLFTKFWDDPYCNNVTTGPLLPNITAEMTRFGLPFINPTCTPCTWEDAAKKFGKAVLRGPEAIHDPSRAFCPCPITKTLEQLMYNLYHLPPAGRRRYYPAEAIHDTGFLRKLRAPQFPHAWRRSGLKTAMLEWLWAQVNHIGDIWEIEWSGEEWEKFSEAGWIVEGDRSINILPC